MADRKWWNAGTVLGCNKPMPKKDACAALMRWAQPRRYVEAVSAEMHESKVQQFRESIYPPLPSGG